MPQFKRAMVGMAALAVGCLVLSIWLRIRYNAAEIPGSRYLRIEVESPDRPWRVNIGVQEDWAVAAALLEDGGHRLGPKVRQARESLLRGFHDRDPVKMLTARTLIEQVQAELAEEQWAKATEPVREHLRIEFRALHKAWPLLVVVLGATLLVGWVLFGRSFSTRSAPAAPRTL